MLGGTFGAFVWVPALVVTLVVFGVPLWHGQRAARQGIGREEKAERTVALVAVTLACLALMTLPLLPFASLQAWWLGALAAIGLVGGSVAALDATRRARERRAFLVRVESGEAAGYRIDTAVDQARQLVRVVATGEGSYREPRFAELLAELDDAGEVKRVHRAS